MKTIDKKSLFLQCMQEGTYRKLAWSLRAFSITKGEGAVGEPFLLEGKWVVKLKDSEGEIDLYQISDAEAGKPVYSKRELFKVAPGDFIGCAVDAEVPYTWVLWHHIVIVYAFGDKIPFNPEPVSLRDIEKIIAKRLTDNPKELPGKEHDKIYVYEYLRFTEAVATMLAGLTQIFTPGTTRKSLVTDPKIRQVRARLLKETEGRHHDPATISMIKSELEKIDRDWVKGDDSEDYLIGKKNFSIVRMKTLCMHGEESAFGDGTNVTLIPTSLDEGLDLTHLPDYANSLREGSFNRGAQTAMGGEEVQYLIRVFQNHAITEDDCGTILGLNREVPVVNGRSFVGYYIIEGGKTVALTDDNISKYVGKKVVLRSPMLCRTEGAGYCAKCMGDSNAKFPLSLGTQASDVGSMMLYIFMKKAHGTALRTTRFDLKTDLY